MRLWSGKSEVVKATVKIVENWSNSFIETNDRVEGDLTSSHIIATEAEGDANDLFISDDWFLNQSSTNIDEEEDIQETVTSTQKSTEEYSEEEQMQDENAINDTMLPQVSFIGLCRLLMVQAFPTSRATFSVSEDEVLPYRASVLQSLTDLLNNLESSATCLLYTSPSPRDKRQSRMPSSA